LALKSGGPIGGGVGRLKNPSQNQGGKVGRFKQMAGAESVSQKPGRGEKGLGRRGVIKGECNARGGEESGKSSPKNSSKGSIVLPPKVRQGERGG